MMKDYETLLDYAFIKFRIEADDGEWDLLGKYMVICLDSFEVYFLPTPSRGSPRTFNYYISESTDGGKHCLLDFIMEIEDDFREFIHRLECQHNYLSVLTGEPCGKSVVHVNKCIKCGEPRR